jgi:hypothetical protein
LNGFAIAKNLKLMVQSLSISKQLTTIAAVQERFEVTYATDDRFFPEWLENLPGLTEAEIQTLDRLQQRFFEHRNRSSLPEGTVDKLMISPLLDLAGFYDSRFTTRTESAVEISLAERGELLQGRIDTLIFQDQFWVLVVEAKSTTFSLSIAIPQALTYMLAAPRDQDFIFGLVTNGGEFQFIKLWQTATPSPQFDLSEHFSLLPPHRSRLSQVLQLLKRIQTLISNEITTP